ncbi:lactadherin-like isoform X1 [Styela clava]
MSNGQQAPCDRTTCSGRPGKRGQEGLRGLKGEKGEVGQTGTPGELVTKVAHLEKLLEMIMAGTQKDLYCGMGMKSREIPDSAISVSSSYSKHQGRYARLDEQPSEIPISYGVWHPIYNRVGEWIQIDLGKMRSVAGVITQGRPNCPCEQWVTSYKVKYGNSTNKYVTITENGRDKIFPANTDMDTKVANLFQTPVVARYIRIYPQTGHNFMVMRLELIRGECSDLY